MNRLRRWMPLVLVAVLAAFFRLYQIDAIPPGLYGDEAANGMDASAIERGERFPIYIEASVKWQSQEALYHYAMAGVFALFGTTATAVRLTSALIGIVTVVLFFVLCRQLCGTRVAFIAAVLLAVSRWHVTFSRIGFRGILVPLWVVLVLLALLALCRRRTVWAAVVFGGTLALGYHTYPPFWIVPVPCAVVLAIVLRHAEQVSARRALVLAGWIAMSFLVMSAPLIAYAVAKPDYYFARAVSTATPFQAPGDHRLLLVDSLEKSIFMLYFRGDTNPRHNIPGKPLLDPITGVAFLAGVWIVVKTLRTETHLKVGLLLFWLLLLLPAAVTGEAPHALRSIGAIPAVCLISGLGLDRIARLTQRRAIALALVLAALTVAAALNYRAYFHEWAGNPEVAGTFSADVQRFFEYVADLSETNDLYACPYVQDGPQTRFFNIARHAPLHRLEDDAAFVAPAAAAHDRVYVCDLPAVNAFIESLYPQAEVIGRYAVYGSHSGRVYRVARTQLRQTLTAEQRGAVLELLRAPAEREADPL